AVSAVRIVGGVFDVEVHVAELGVGGEWTPNASVTGIFVGVVEPRLGTRLALARDGVKHPQLFSGVYIECHHVALHVVWRGGSGRQSGSHHNNTIRYHWWRAVADPARNVALKVQI